MTDPAVSTQSSTSSRRISAAAVPLAIFAILSAIFAIALRTADPSRLPSALIDKPAPAIQLPALDGLTEGGRSVPGFSTADLVNGRPSIVNFWASWCAPCIEEHPLLVRLAADTGVRILGVNYKDQAIAARRFLGRFGNPFAAVGVDANGRAAIDWGVYGMPETFVLNGRGEILHKHVGALTEAAIKSDIMPALARAAR
jgi:cytochrome c biogenesis protein CcmG/thiol:disulfide interchange protein DsbE